MTPKVTAAQCQEESRNLMPVILLDDAENEVGSPQISTPWPT